VARFTYSLSGGSTGNSRTYRFEVVDEGGFVLAAGFDRSPIADESIDFGTDDPSFDTNWLTVSLTQSVTATFDVSYAPYRFFKAAIGPIIPNEPEPED
jgi:hypothetical protein